jgi:predicted nucleic acid-binding protein
MSNVAEAVYFDSNTLVYWALGRSGSSKADEQRCASAVEALVDGDDSLACSPLTLTEFTSTTWSAVRSGASELRHFGEPELNAALERLMQLLASGRIRAHNLHPRSFEVGLGIVAAGTREKGRAFRAPDAMHLFEACQWARVIDRQVVVATTDSDFHNMLAAFPEFGRYVDLRDLTAP